jgi:hypothetical protein
MKKLLAIPLTLFVVGVTTAIFAKTVAWAADDPQCRPDQDIFGKGQMAFKPLDLQKTTNTIFIAGAIGSTNFGMSGRNSTQEMQCAMDTLNNLTDPGGLNLTGGKVDFTGMRDKIVTACQGLAATPCPDLNTTWGKVASSNGGKFSYSDAQSAGSLMGFANAVQGSAVNEPIPTNLAYFWNDSIKNIPFAGRALAADVNYDSMGNFVEAILGVWKAFRNLGYGILSVVMLATGIMIMLRRKLPPQLTVTAQYALPKIVIAVVLITFSYPIGAVVAKGSWYLRELVVSVIAFAAGEDGINSLFPVPMGTLYLLFKAKGYFLVGSGVVTAIFLAVTSAVAGIFWILLWLRSIFLYIKIVLSIVFAPIQFALGAIPGNEKMTETWFKNLIANGASIVALWAYANVIVLVLLLTITGPAPITGSNTAADLISVIFFPFFAIWGFYQAFRVPSVVHNAIIGEQKPGGRR